MRLVWQFDHPFTDDQWPLPIELQQRMLRIVRQHPDQWAGGHVPHVEGQQLQIVRLDFKGGATLPGHPDLDSKLWHLPGVVLVDPGENPWDQVGKSIWHPDHKD